MRRRIGPIRPSWNSPGDVEVALETDRSRRADRFGHLWRPLMVTVMFTRRMSVI